MLRSIRGTFLRKNFTHIINVITIALIIQCFILAIQLIQSFAKDGCFIRIEETTAQIAEMFNHAMDENREKLELFADIMAAEDLNDDEGIRGHMANFCQTQYFSAICIKRADGSAVFYGDHPHDVQGRLAFDVEVGTLPYVSEVFGTGDSPAERYFCQAVPVVREGKTVAILYGYMTLEPLPGFVSSTAYGGSSFVYVVDGDTGDFLMDEYHGTLSNIFDGSMKDREAKDGYDINDMKDGIRNGKSGYFVFRSERTGEWYYTYYMPLGINNWSMQLTIDEPTAFAEYHAVNGTIIVLGVCVVALMFIHVLALMAQTASINKRDKERLHVSNYVNEVQRTLINAHSNPGFVEQALQIIARELEAETVLLLPCNENTITSAYYWPSRDKKSAMDLVGRNIRDEFPEIYDQLSLGTNVCYHAAEPSMTITGTAKELFALRGVNTITLVPIQDNVGMLRGTVAAINAAGTADTAAMLECLTYDFFMAITNLENHNIIRRMGYVDYLTGIKNRNCYEAELPELAGLEGESLWCVFVDVNGLHEMNNEKGHKAGDTMLCTVAEIVKRIFGERFSYRLGGDEFLAFALDSSEEAFAARKNAITEELKRKGYYVSIGYQGTVKNAAGVFEVERIIAEAETRMYQDKSAYYQQKRISRQRDGGRV